MTRNKTLTFRLTAEEHRKLERIARQEDMSMSQVLRRAIRELAELAELAKR